MIFNDSQVELGVKPCVRGHDLPMTLTLMAALAAPSLFSRVTLYCPASPWILLSTSRWQEVYSFLFRQTNNKSQFIPVNTQPTLTSKTVLYCIF